MKCLLCVTELDQHTQGMTRQDRISSCSLAILRHDAISCKVLSLEEEKQTMSTIFHKLDKTLKRAKEIAKQALTPENQIRLVYIERDECDAGHQSELEAKKRQGEG